MMVRRMRRFAESVRDVRRFLSLILCECHSGEDGSSYSEHEAYSSGYHVEGCYDVDGGNAVGAYTVADEYAVDDGDEGIEDHSQEGREEYPSEEYRNPSVCVVKTGGCHMCQFLMHDS